MDELCCLSGFYTIVKDLLNSFHFRVSSPEHKMTFTQTQI